MADNNHIVKSFFTQINKTVENKTNQMTQIKSAIVHSVNLDGTVNITIPPSGTVYHNIQNQSIYRNLIPGDNVKVIKENNDLSNMWIMGGFGLQQIEEKRTEQSQLWEGDFSKTITSLESTAKANSAKIKSLASWQSQVYTNVSNIAEIQQQANDNEASISLIVESTGNTKQIKRGSIIAAINNNESTVAIDADKINFEAGVYSISADRIDFESNNYSIDANKINFEADDFIIDSSKINLSGYATFDSLKTDGTTEINGANIKTGLIKSANYVVNTSGTSINLEDGVIDNKYFKLNASGGSFTIGDDNLYITIDKNAHGYDTFFLKTKQDDGTLVVNNLEICRTVVNSGTDDECNSIYIGGNNGITLGLMRGNSPSDNLTSIIEMTFNGSKLYGKWDIDQDQILSHNLGTTQGFTLESSSDGSPMRYGSLYRDNLYYTSINTDESFGLRLRCKDEIGIQMINSAGIQGTLMGSWYLGSKEIATVSDRNIKTNIININENYNDLFDKLSPVLYQYSDGTLQTYVGFIAQDVEDVAKDVGIALDTFGLVTRNQLIDNEGNNVERVYLHYNDFIALNTWQIQQLKSRILELEAKITTLEQK